MNVIIKSEHGLDKSCQQTTHHFDNGYGASILRGGMVPYGNLELAVLKQSELGWSICYDTYITDDVLGHLQEEDIPLLLEKISKL